MFKKQSTLTSWLRRPRLSTVAEDSSPAVPDWFLNSNVRQLVRNFIERLFPQESHNDENLHQKILERFYKHYTKRPTSRRSPLLRLYELILMPSLVPPDMNAICFQHQVLTECFVDMSRNNFYLMCENKAYDMIMRRDEKVRNGQDFPTPETLTRTSLRVYRANSSKFAKKLKRKEIQKEKEDSDAEMLRNFYDDNYSPPPEAMKRFRKRLKQIRKTKDSEERFGVNVEGFVSIHRSVIEKSVPVSKPRRLLAREPEEDVSRCDKKSDETPMDKSPERKKPKRQMEDSLAKDQLEPTTPEKQIGEEAMCMRKFLSDNFNLELNVSPSYFKKKMNEARAATPSRKSPVVSSSRATDAVSPKVSPRKSPGNKNQRRRPTLLELTNFSDIYNDNEELAIPKRKKTFEDGNQNVVLNDHNYMQKPVQKRKTTAAPLRVKLRRIEEAKRRGVWCEEEEEEIRESSEIDNEENRENPQWLEDFWGDAALEMDVSPSYFTGCPATVEIPSETESLSQEIDGALISSSTLAVREECFIVVLREDSEAAVQGHAAMEKRLCGGIIDEVLDIPCDRKNSEAGNTGSETEESNVGENLDAGIHRTVHVSHAEEDVNVTQDILQTQVSSGGSWETVMEYEDSFFVSQSQLHSVLMMDEDGLFSEVQTDKQATVTMANEIEISTEKISENKLENVQLPLITWLHSHLLDNDVEIVGTKPAVPAVVFVEDLTQGTPFPEMSQDPLIAELSQILGV